ncbi:MAG: hypothetical protein ABOK23_08365 [Candidatus Methanoperedens sp.]|nr:hypothetical protein [Candidatus Methanoperedens sp.]MCZ7396379.1 hypothetical protein [Candidatus Methanoperedens sp.]
MDIASIIIFFIYVILILMILVYISPILSLLVLMLVPVASVYLLPGLTIAFFKQQEFSFVGISIQNLHILLLIWSAIIGVVASTEIVSWYLLKEEKPAPMVKKPEVLEKPVAASVPLKPGEAQKSVKSKVENLLLKLGKIMSGRKS